MVASVVQQISCMAEAIYHEARGEGKEGQELVAQVIYNRTQHDGFPDDTCAVINQRGQFTFKRHGGINDKKSYMKAYEIASNVMYNRGVNNANDVLYYHNTSVNPRWTSHTVKLYKRIGKHVFYRRIS